MAKPIQTTKKDALYVNYDLINQSFLDYYTAQGIVEPNERDLFIESIKTPLPTSFRLTKTSESFPLVKKCIEEIIQSLPDELKPQTFQWNPYTYQVNVRRRQVKECAQYEKLHKFMVLMNEAGEISRQEIVSMIPALLLDVHEGMSVLDICAAPGSKTSQLVEMTGKNGCVVANDADRQRAKLLIHQTMRLSMPHVVITNYKAQVLNFDGFLFDRMLCDVPCSGDGTIRKNADSRTKWNVMGGYGLHREQIDIMKNVICHLKVGGKFVYSTCSLNPIEDEAVVSEILRTYGDAVELIDARNTLPGLKYKQGISTWKAFDNEMKEVAEPSTKIPKSTFPPSEDEAKKFHLEYTLRILPHLQNTGGFYTAVFVKKGETPLKKRKPKYVKKDQQLEQPEKKAETKEKLTKKMMRLGGNIGPQVMKKLLETENGETIFAHLKEYYGFTETFPKEQLYVMAEDRAQISFVSKIGCEVMKDLKVLSAGVKIFKRKKGEKFDSYRAGSEGIGVLKEFIGEKRKLVISTDMLVRLLKETEVKNSEFGRTFDGCGSYVIQLNDGELKWNCLCGWVGKESVKLSISKQELECFGLIFGVGDKKVIGTAPHEDDVCDTKIEKK
ncbi:hypothetical protein EIN_184050 [Entamoeba invadens IP1]|uniref:hypothetical protein n=1 Tax=Entamoeba invadens IP1 TaxID=370355 RepID=UPI0002C3F908|nr:hypothetical protein EIN_184050 [Entamoeba invadens IP1]ELP94078.1 hypothetical protein EIN_184050 [Entamoeba invadens IP1]|eukprot:XP_004260849.1 hypothetical protein EIN_184050 [Entamoeba invadens IP1]